MIDRLPNANVRARHQRAWSATAPLLSLLALLVAIVTGCYAKTDAKTGDSTAAAPSAKTPASTDATPSTAATDTAGCGFMPTPGHDNPDSLMAEYLARDGNGEFAQSSTWRDHAVFCPLQSPGWDGFTLIASYNTAPLSRTADSARFLVTYKRVGLLEQDAAGYMVKTDAGEERDTMMLVHTQYGWRLNDWDQEPHLLPKGALTLPTMKAADKKKLQAMTGKP